MAEKTQFEVLWEKVKERARPLINPVSFDTFIDGLVPVDVINKKLVLKALTETGANTVTKSHLPRLREAAAAADVGLTDIVIVVDGSDAFSLDELPDAMEEVSVQTDKRFTFDSFVVGASNKFVYAAAKSVAAAPGENFNPLYIYGGSGLGKTHLLQAIANELAQKKPSLKVLYTTSERFLNEYVDSIVYSKSSEGKG